ncbi:MAG TPA: succinate dehydrogenase cytochrome b subunit [Bryobacteraceae bacterium]|nr:succinate dehydrogenase cytochrome b subunit [Bryobacteraceae bacterium]
MATAVGLAEHRPANFYASTVGKKAVMAVSGAILFLFVVGHLVGNLQIYEGPEKLNNYARFLRSMPALLWGVRITLLVMVILHIWSSVQLALRKLDARPTGYIKKKSTHSSYASRTMYWSGPIILAFVIYHLLDFTFGTVNPHFEEGNVYANVIASFSLIPVSAFYVFAMMLLCMHLYHGLWSMFQSLGFFHPRYTPMLKRGAAVVAILIAAGNISIPVSVLAGLVR